MTHGPRGSRRTTTMNFTEEEIRYIRASTDPIPVLALRYNKDRSSISRIRSHRSYKWVADKKETNE